MMKRHFVGVHSWRGHTNGACPVQINATYDIGQYRDSIARQTDIVSNDYVARLGEREALDAPQVTRHRSRGIFCSPHQCLQASPAAPIRGKPTSDGRTETGGRPTPSRGPLSGRPSPDASQPPHRGTS
eukprot:814303_1